MSNKYLEKAASAATGVVVAKNIEKKANEYLEKIAFIGAIPGVIAAKEGDKIGGAVAGEVALAASRKSLTRLARRNFPMAVLGAVGSGTVGGHLYSKAKAALLKDKKPKNQD